MFARSSHRKKSGKHRQQTVARPGGVIAPRVQAVGPERFAIVSVDCAKARSKWMLADFYGNVLHPPEVVEHNRAGLAQAIAHLRQSCLARNVGDLIVAVERTGRYHQPVQRSFAEAGYEVRIVHPFTTKHHRLPADPGNKTDDTDLLAIHRAAVNGFALVQRPFPLFWEELQLLVRQRRDLVEKTARLRCQIREHLESALPGYAACFSKLWEHPAALQLAWDLGSPQVMLAQGLAGMGGILQVRKIRFQKRTLEQVLAWAGAAASSAQAAAGHRRVASALDQDRREKQAQIRALELDIARGLIRSDYLRLLQLPGINVISAAEFAAEMGPIANYASSRNITGRAGLYPSRYQSDQVDHPDGPLVRRGNRRLRFAILLAADNLLKCNRYFQGLAQRWAHCHPQDLRVRLGQRFCRISYQLAASKQPFAHPAMQERDYVLKKLVLFFAEHDLAADKLLREMHAAMEQLHPQEYPGEAAALQKQFPTSQRGGGPVLLRAILPEILLRLAAAVVQSAASSGA